MKKLCLLFLMVALPTFAQESCQEIPAIAPPVVDSLAEPVLQAAQQSYTKLLDLKVNHGGKGDLSILLNPAGEVEAVKFYYKDNDGVKVYVVTSEELNQGKAIQYQPKNGDVSPLRLSAVRPPGLNPGKGGTFNLMIATKLNPPMFREHMVKLSLESGKWVVDALGVRTKEVVLSPGVSFFSWDGTFQKVEFK